MNEPINRGRSGPVRRARMFLRDEAGAVTVDWVVLTAAIVLFGVAAGFIVTSAVPEVAAKINTVLENTTVVPD